MRRNTLLSLLSILLIVILAACGTTSASMQTATPATTASAVAASTPNVPQGWVSYGKPTDGFSIALPPEFKAYNVTPENIDKTIAELKNSDPQVAPLIDWLKAQPKQENVTIAFYALDVSQQSRASGFMSSINVVKEHYDYGISLDDYVQAGLKSLEEIDGLQKPIGHERIKIGTSEFESIRYAVRIASQERAAAETTLVGVNGNTGYLMTLTTTDDQMDKYGPIFDQIVQTFQLR